MLQECLYCPEPADSREHPLPAAFGEFQGAPQLHNRVCTKCNNRLGVLEEQLTRCGPEAFFRRFYGVQGRPTHDLVNPFYRGSAGGQRLVMTAFDKSLGIEVELELTHGREVRQLRQLIFIEKSGKPHHLFIPDEFRDHPEKLRVAYQKLGVTDVAESHLVCDSEESAWVEPLLRAVWPSMTLGERSLGARNYESGAVIKVQLTDRYFRAIAKIGFHYFLSQFPEYSGHEPLFADIRQYILEDGAGVDRANEFIGKRQHPILGEMLNGARPDSWRAHVLCAEIRPGECLAYVQMFLSEDWPASVYTIRLGHNPAVVDSRAAGHAYMYYADGPRGKFSGDAVELDSTRLDSPPPPPTPVINPA